MPEHHDDQKRNESNDQDKNKPNLDDEIIELSDIAINITPEDETIVELTEDLIDEAFVGFTGATSELIEEDEQVLDLSGTGTDYDAVSQPDAGATESDDIAGSADEDGDDLEGDISRELDDYFGTEDDAAAYQEASMPEKVPEDEDADAIFPAGPKTVEEQPLKEDTVRITSGQLDEAIERVIRKMFAEKINRILDEVIERTVTEEISQLKDYLIGITGKKE